MSDSKKNEFLVACAVGTLFHPFSHAKILIQLGHEPDPPVLKDTWKSMIGIGKKAYYYPSVFTYCKRIREEIGVYALFTTGLPAKIFATIIQTSVTDKVKQSLMERSGISGDDSRQRERYPREILSETLCSSVAHTIGTVVSHPLHVIMVRQIAQFVGKETEYSTIFSSVSEIWSHEGIKGFFAGLSARVLGELLLIGFSEMLTYLLNRYVLDDRVAPDIKSFSPTISHTLVSTFVYKYTVVSNMMVVNGSRLEVAMNFKSTHHCYQYLKAQGALTRGGSMLFRMVPAGNIA